jgi:hypothetical protein
MSKQVSKEENTELSLRFKSRYTGLKRPVTTAARTITDKKGQRSQPSKKQETRNKAKKNHKMISRCLESLKVPPDWMGFSAFELQQLSPSFLVTECSSIFLENEFSAIK